MNENLQTLSTLLRATGTYVYNRIVDARGKEAYRVGMQACLRAVEKEFSVSVLENEHLELLKNKIQDIENDVDKVYRRTLFRTNSTARRYYLLACQHAMEALISVERRFITGGSGTNLKCYDRINDKVSSILGSRIPILVFNSEIDIFDVHEGIQQGQSR